MPEPADLVSGPHNCAQGYPVRNKHNNCPYSLLCATCDMDADLLQVEEEFRCPHGTVFARRFKGGSYAGRPAQDACVRCGVQAIFAVGPSEMFPSRNGREDRA